ncbi:sensor histidine kinase [Nocardioides sp.]|uniref:sensor histidine kinase n=1 Tax=Nocardioides sp. TaxID=35761 RepID=UPI002EDAA417
MSETPPNRIGRAGPLFAGIWLFFLVDPLVEGWAHRDEARGVAGILATVAFATVYMTLWIRMRQDRARLVADPPLRFTAPYLGALVALGGVMVGCLGEQGMASVVYVAVASVMVFPLRLAAPVVVTLVAGTLGLSAVEDWGSQVGLAFGVMAASVAIFGLRTVMSRNIALLRAEQENARLAVENERTRFARDLHDILGHSLTVITVKAELAQRLLDQDTAETRDRARTELADLERLSRDALADVRRAVEGYRDLTLPGELARARAALAAAEVEGHLPNSADDVPTELRELFAWTVREGVTNVLRHSGARTCEIRLTPTSAEVRDDGRGSAPTTGGGSGLAGLRERAAAAGATVVTRDLAPGFSLRVAR